MIIMHRWSCILKNSYVYVTYSILFKVQYKLDPYQSRICIGERIQMVSKKNKYTSICRNRDPCTYLFPVLHTRMRFHVLCHILLHKSLMWSEIPDIPDLCKPHYCTGLLVLTSPTSLMFWNFLEHLLKLSSKIHVIV